MRPAGPKFGPSRIFAGPLLLWLLAQLAALFLAAARVPLAAGYPRPAEFQAVRLMLATQFAWAAVFLPTLLCSWTMTAVAAASAWVMLLLAAALAGWPLADVLPVGSFLCLWLVVLGTWRRALPEARSRAIASALAVTYAVGGALVCYLQFDFGTSSARWPGVAFGPLWMAVAMPRHVPASGWALLAGFEAIALALWIAIPRLRRTGRI